MPDCTFRSTESKVVNRFIMVFSPAEKIVGTRNLSIIIAIPSPIALSIFIAFGGFAFGITAIKFINRRYLHSKLFYLVL